MVLRVTIMPITVQTPARLRTRGTPTTMQVSRAPPSTTRYLFERADGSFHALTEDQRLLLQFAREQPAGAIVESVNDSQGNHWNAKVDNRSWVYTAHGGEHRSAIWALCPPRS